MALNDTQTPDRLFDDDPVLGAFIAYYPSNRVRLLLRAGIGYAVPVLFLQVFFAPLDTATASIILIGGYTLLALIAGWYLTHLWNREVVVYERGFSYREGSHTGLFQYHEIVRIQARTERIAYANLFTRDIYDYTLITDQDEHLRLNNVYKNIAELALRLERAITRARKPIVQARLQRGESLAFAHDLHLTRESVEYDGRKLNWDAFQGHQIEDGNLILVARDEPSWARIPLNTLDNQLLLVTLLHEHQPQPTSQTTPTA